jgi:uncharacterized protein
MSLFYVMNEMSKKCPICEHNATVESSPFCSARCKEIDLGRWFTEGYSIPVVELDDIPEEELNKLFEE